jgi:hypothetical protein
MRVFVVAEGDEFGVAEDVTHGPFGEFYFGNGVGSCDGRGATCTSRYRAFSRFEGLDIAAGRQTRCSEASHRQAL